MSRGAGAGWEAGLVTAGRIKFSELLYVTVDGHCTTSLKNLEERISVFCYKGMVNILH